VGRRQQKQKLSAQLVEDEEYQLRYERAAGIDVAKASAVICVRLPPVREGGRRVSGIETAGATVPEVAAAAGRLLEAGVQMVSMESASDYWRVWFYVLEAAGLAVQLVNSSRARQLAGRPKTDRSDAQWLARLTEMGLLRPSFVPPAEIRELRDYTRMRIHLVHDRTRACQRLEKLLEGALVKLTSVASLATASAKAMIRAMIAGQRDPQALAALAQTSMKAKHDDLVRALTGMMFGDHPAHLARMLLNLIGYLDEEIGILEDKIAACLDQIPRAQGVDGDGATGPGAGTGPDAAVLPAVKRLGRDPRRQRGPGPRHHRRNRPGHDPVPHRRAPRVLGRAGPGRPPVRSPHPQGEKGPGRQLPARPVHPGRQRHRPHRHLPGRAAAPHHKTPRRRQGTGRGRALHPHHHLAPPRRPRGTLR
jgi:transposase